MKTPHRRLNRRLHRKSELSMQVIVAVIASAAMIAIAVWFGYKVYDSMFGKDRGTEESRGMYIDFIGLTNSVTNLINSESPNDWTMYTLSIKEDYAIAGFLPPGIFVKQGDPGQYPWMTNLQTVGGGLTLGMPFKKVDRESLCLLKKFKSCDKYSDKNKDLKGSTWEDVRNTDDCAVNCVQFGDADNTVILMGQYTTEEKNPRSYGAFLSTALQGSGYETKFKFPSELNSLDLYSQLLFLANTETAWFLKINNNKWKTQELYIEKTTHYFNTAGGEQKHFTAILIMPVRTQEQIGIVEKRKKLIDWKATKPETAAASQDKYVLLVDEMIAFCEKTYTSDSGRDIVTKNNYVEMKTNAFIAEVVQKQQIMPQDMISPLQRLVEEFNKKHPSGQQMSDGKKLVIDKLNEMLSLAQAGAAMQGSPSG